MCEWLSSQQWCDVQIQCAGRSFRAHRAVLASVSSFLRQILLSTGYEDTPTFIVLPDFDLDAMSSVLYYIYNGEVIIQKHKLETFLEIVRTMQIFVDEKYLPNAYYGYTENQEANCVKDDKANKEVFSLGTCEDKEYIRIKKGSEIRDLLHPYSVNNKDWQDNPVRHHELSGLDHLQSSADRQRSFLRDLYIEAYPQNGNVNGQAGVLAISNACYRQPTSVISLNANDKYPKGDDAHNVPKTSKIPSFCHPPISKNSLSGRYVSEEIDMKSFDSMYQKPPLTSFTHSSNFFSSSFSMPQSMFTLGVTDVNFQSANEFCFNKLLLGNDENYAGRGCKVSRSCKSGKGTILNQVLQNPWCPRLPINNRPLRKMEKDADSSLPMSEKVEDIKGNDRNNNVQILQNIDDARARISTPTIEKSNVLPISTCVVGGTDFKCTICNQVFTTNETLSAHMKRHSTTRYNCGDCGKSFSQLRNYKYHMSIHRGTREFAATCSVCGKHFNDRGYLSSHMKIHRNRKEYKCSQCPKSFNQRVAYNMHVRIHTGIKPHVCGECGKAFSRKMLLKQHQRTHSGERPYACPHCDKRFADRSNMTLHLRLHTGVKPFSCTLCAKSFTKKHHLKSHLNFHTGAKPYSCPRCDLAFTQSSNMRTHLKKCTAPDPVNDAHTSR